MSENRVIGFHGNAVDSTMTIKDDDSKLQEIFRLYGKGEKKESKYAIGIFGDTHPNEAKKGIYNEFGTSTVPQRPFFSRAIENNNFDKKIKTAIKKNIKQDFEVEDIVVELSEISKKEIENKIYEQRFKKLAPSTIRRKGNDIKLIDTGKMVESISTRKME